MNASDFVRDSIARSKYTYDEIAELCGVSRGAIFNVTRREDGVERAKLELVLKLCEVLGIPLFSLISMTGENDLPDRELDKLETNYMLLSEYDRILLSDFAEFLIERSFKPDKPVPVVVTRRHRRLAEEDDDGGRTVKIDPGVMIHEDRSKLEQSGNMRLFTEGTASTE